MSQACCCHVRQCQTGGDGRRKKLRIICSPGVGTAAALRAWKRLVKTHHRQSYGDACWSWRWWRNGLIFFYAIRHSPLITYVADGETTIGVRAKAVDGPMRSQFTCPAPSSAACNVHICVNVSVRVCASGSLHRSVNCFFFALPCGLSGDISLMLQVTWSHPAGLTCLSSHIKTSNIFVYLNNISVVDDNAYMHDRRAVRLTLGMWCEDMRMTMATVSYRRQQPTTRIRSREIELLYTICVLRLC